jgi:drug/metabolite transporter (DMT)-like permease
VRPSAALLIFAIPVLTGLAATLWSRLTQESWAIAALSSVVTHIAVLSILLWRGVPLKLEVLMQPRVAAAFVVASLCYGVVSFAWMASLNVTGMALIGLVEIGYPIFIILFTLLLFGGVELRPVQYLGGALIFIGSFTVLIGSK